MRILLIALGAYGLAACSSGSEEMQPQAEEGADAIDCALGDGSEYGPDCLVEREEVDGKTQLIVRHPDGGFRRFEQVADGRGLIELDGADEVERSLDGDTLVISVGTDSYRFDANVSGGDTGADDAEPAAE